MPTNRLQPNKLSTLQPTKFRLTFRRIPTVTYFLQSVNIPGVSTGEYVRHTPFVDMYLPGDKIVYDTLNLNFIVDSDMRGWFELHDWIRGLSFPGGFQEYRKMLKESADFGKSTSDATLSILSNDNASNIRLRFLNCFPMSVGSIQMMTSDSAENTMVADATFRFESYEIDRTAP